MADTFRDGIEAAAAVIEAYDPGLLGKDVLAELAGRVRGLQAGEIMGDLDKAFEDFKAVYKPLNAGGKGQRNHWAPAKVKFRQLVKVRKHDPMAIVTGTRAYAATCPNPQYVPAPAVFLNKEMFTTDYALAIDAARRGRVDRTGQSLFDVGRELGHFDVDRELGH